MANQPYHYKPDFVYPPGETLLELLEEQMMTQADLALRMGRPTKTINELTQGKCALTPETALQLEKVFKVPARMWLSLEQSYREYLAREAEVIDLTKHLSWINSFPYQDMMVKKWIPHSTDQLTILRSILSFLGIVSPPQWDDLWGKYQAQFRKSERYTSTPHALSAWLRQGELQAQMVQCAPYNETQFKRLLNKEIRELTRYPAQQFQGELRNLCATVGVAVVFVPQILQAKVSGATCWISHQKALIQLSLRYKTSDQLWFSFFHEAAHILLHKKRAVFVDLEDQINDQQEAEANQFAGDLLIPSKKYEQFIASTTSFSHANVQAFADQLNIAPGIVVGRLQHDKKIPYSHLNGLKKKLAWVKKS